MTHECDWPPAVVGKPVVTRSVHDLATSHRATSTRRVTASMHGGSSLYELDEEALAAAEPDLILTQELCRVCAVSYARSTRSRARIELTSRSCRSSRHRSRGSSTRSRRSARWRRSRTPRSTSSKGCASGSARSSSGSRRVVTRAGQSPRVVALEWLDPPFAVGHWVPEQIRRAGGWDLLGADGRKARQTTWDAVAEVDPEMLFLMPCGFHLAETIDEWAADAATRRGSRIWQRPGAAPSSRSMARRTSRRPGPRVIDGIEMLAEIMDPAASSTSRRPAAGRRSRSAEVPFRASFSCLWCGAAHADALDRTTSRAGRSCARTASARPATTDSCGSGCARP